MPKNPHGPRGGASKKPAPTVTSDGNDTSYIVFSNAKEDPKKGKKKDDAVKEDKDTKGKGKAKEPAGKAEDAPKKPDTRTLIGGASWTGKLPVNILSEHCQKQKWAKPDYHINKNPQNGLFSASVVLKATNAKTQETITLPSFKLPPSHAHLALQATPVEARHFAATYTLFRVSSMKNHHMAMPPTYRDLWKGPFQDLKKTDVAAGASWMYEADPFLAHKEREMAKATATKNREEAQKQKAKEQNEPNGPFNLSGTSSGGSDNRMKGWTNVPKIELGKRTRKDIERLIRRDALWNPHNVKMSPQVRSHVIDEVARLGFRKSHVEEAAELCKDREEILEWLLIHVPEDDLPSWSLPEGYVAGISMASANLKREAAIKRLAATGYATELCEEAYDGQGGDEAKAAGVLQTHLLQDMDYDDLNQEPSDNADSWDTDDTTEPWDEEQTTLKAIYDDRYESPSPGVCQIRIDVLPKSGKKFILQARKPFGPYPLVPPIISIHSDLPAYIRLSIIRKALEYSMSSLLGTPMIFDLVDWLEREIPDIIERPGRLSDVSSGISAADSGAHTREFRRNENKSWPRKPVNWRPGTETSLRMLAQWQSRQSTPAQQRMLAVRQNLPAWGLRDDIVHAVECNQVVIISGETGSGKSTQSVQFVLDDLIKRKLGEAANIICTQPRRISALGLADRVADERCSMVGDEIGYAIRGESKQKPGVTKITFVTTGVLLRRLQTSGGSSDDVVAAVADVSHVVVDEVHERSLDTDFLLVLLREILRRRKDLKVILMSATLDADVFESYFSGVSVGRVEIEGRTHPVEDFYVDDVIRMTGFNGHRDEEFEDEEDAQKNMAEALKGVGMRINYDLIAQTVRHIDAQLGNLEGGILIFLPGTMEIDRTIQALRQIPNIYALPLHASLLPVEQKRVFPLPPKGKRKVIAATNVAETSITIEDIVAVIDTGRVKETSFDPQNNMVKLEEVWASRAACKQRRGRAGRVRAGTCYKLYTRNAEMLKMMERPDPEIRRVPLEQLCLSVKAMGIRDVPNFLAGAITPPDSSAVDGAIELLRRMGALDGDELTALGRHLSMIPADLRCSKLMVYGATFGCLEACLTIASILTLRSPFVSPKEKRDESKAARASFAQNQGDLIADLRGYETWSAMRAKGSHPRDLRAWCEGNFLSTNTLHDISSNRSQYLSALKETSFIPATYTSHDPSTHSKFNAHNMNSALLRALIAGAFNPQLARIELPSKKFAASVSGAVELDPEARTIKYFTQTSGRVFIHPSSTLFDAHAFPSGSRFVAYFTKIATSKVFVRDLTPFNSYSLLLFSGPIGLDTLGRGVLVDGWVRLRGWARIGVLVGRLRGMLDEVLLKKIEEPGWDLGGSEVVGIVRRLVELDGLDN
ncbi:DEAD/DEAH box helicase-like protein [Lepidopterella palustris CBS 459.81]|uniref:RNA helicase n=1 Tax=Lepidopterella palustris CBS 459.81 TaxID=1314670 RepID=A0A8E2E1T9_9PEZI|nr:DEAD/DEAH box helicase-like protein [Lepidopterella palustris CBS 459.81]